MVWVFNLFMEKDHTYYCGLSRESHVKKNNNWYIPSRLNYCVIFIVYT
jgi:hypothetical protein